MSQLFPVLFPVRPPETVSMTTRDGVRLDADIYWPDVKGTFPVLLMRQPYGRRIASTVVYAHPTWYAARGFIVAIQDVRGRGSSEGCFQLFAHEVEDGYDAVEWAAQLPQSSGKVGMYGFSYQGMTQLFAAQAQPPSLQAIAPAMVGYYPYQDWAYENGALVLQAGLGWALQLAAESARLRQDPLAFQALRRAAQQLPLNDPNPILPQVLQDYAADSFFHDWVAHPSADQYWQRITPQLQSVDLPMLHIGGWFDPYLRGDIRLYREMEQRSRFPQPVWIGPWGHLPWGRRAGDRDFGPDAESPVDCLQISWFSQILKETETGILNDPPVHLFEMGTNQWKEYAAWPQGHSQLWQLHSSGRAAITQEDGHLIQKTSSPQAPDSPYASPALVMDALVHDPWRPVPSLGGHAGIPAGVFDRSTLECRTDILTYTSPELTESLTIAGQPEVTLHCRSDRPSFDLCVTLSERLPNGNIYPLTQGYGRFNGSPHQWTTCLLPLQPSCFAIAAGQALRLSISAACYPAYGMNSGTRTDQAMTPWLEAQITTLEVCVGPNSPTQLKLPNSPESPRP